MLPRLEVRGHVSRRLQGAVQRVAPAVISAGEAGCVTGTLEQHAAAAMPAHVVVRMDRAACAAHEDDGLASDVEQEEIAGGGDLRGMSRHDPVVAEDALDIALENVRIAIKGLVERVAGPLGRAQLVDPVVPPRRCFGCHLDRPFQSFRISRAALWPGMPETPPPGCVEEPHWYRPRTGER